MTDALTLGWAEWCALPTLGLPAIKAKVDTGAKTSALHAFTIQPFGPAGRRKLRFGIHPIPERPEFEVYCSADIVDQRDVTSSNGETESRYVIETPIRIGPYEWPIQLTLSDREGMSYHMLLGRQALTEFPFEGEPLVMPSLSYQQPQLSYDVYDGLSKKAPTPRSLRIGILTREPNAYSTRRLVEAGETREHVVELIDTQRCYMLINAGRPEVHYDGRCLPPFDTIIPRIGASITAYGTAVTRQFEAMGTFCVNGSHAIAVSRDKLHAHQLLAREGIGMPTTAFASSPKDTRNLIDLMGEGATIVKLLESSQGKGVVLTETRKAAESVVDAFRGLKADFLVQEFVKEAGGEDIRCLVVGGKVVAAIKRRAAPGEFRSNLHQGGSAVTVKISKAERETAIKAAKVLGLGFAGVDLLRSSSGPKVLEVNSSPGLEGVETATGKDVARLLMEAIEKRAASTVRRRRRASEPGQL
ncbi:possible ribosomal protein S6 modification protein [Parvularcula bermudensis HTCC2503]|uniref:Probable alpha-L-glutamate ligase n=1 Tax=Parvularcula bermudensis (strain ATCC BAA-594 / HTCC2503 / KCTC 12087) TaxID=314260 RepID=E0TEU2_PARBH|nr:30S ribosomal protein S6--L-glutamate ligase [Parvularcula bermudensis]ADM09514.1 possible ribosomal protein S6 modification protein [Parvularcula bermudensis HTCC2503]